MHTALDGELTDFFCCVQETHSAEQVSFEQKVPSTESGHIMATQTVESRWGIFHWSMIIVLLAPLWTAIK